MGVLLQNFFFLETLAPSCDTAEGDLLPQFILFAAQCIFGLGEAVYYVFGLTYLDDNAKSSKTPFMISFSYFIKMIGPAVGYNLASFCLSYFISPQLTPTIDSRDPRWIGCWWAGWLVLTGVLVLFGLLMRAFPRELTAKNKDDSIEMTNFISPKVEEPDSLKASLKRLLTNKLMMFNNFATIFYFFGNMPYMMFGPKYIEIQYLQTSAQSNFYVGTLTFVASALGILMSGIAITKLKPSARKLAAWNVLVPALTILALVIKYNLGCAANDNAVVLSNTANCHCDYVKYSPVCGSNNLTYVSACHAGCEEKEAEVRFFNCEMVDFASSGACFVDCGRELTMFLIVSCVVFFLGASGITSNFLISLR